MNDIAVKRTLAAIVLADVVGYSRMMGEDEAGTLQRLTRCRSEFIDATIAGHRGRIVNAVGDSLLLEFGSVCDATRCAIALQQQLADRNAELAESKRIVFRMGVNIGDVIVQDRSLFGDSVNVAARLQTLAEPGGICLSLAAYEQVRDKIDAPFTDGGAHQVKNIARPVEVVSLAAAAIDVLPRQTPAKPRFSFRLLAFSGVAAGLVVALALGGLYLVRHAARLDLAARLEAVLTASQAKMNERTRTKLVADYLAIGPHRALAIAPKAQSHWWTGDWPSVAAAEEKVLERCQIAYNEPCELAAVDDAMAPMTDGATHATREMARVTYAGPFDVEQIPAVRPLVAKRADVVGYLEAPEPKAAAIHPRGVLTVVSGAASQRRAESQALKLCNDDDAAREADGRCYLYAQGSRIVLSQRQTSPIAKP
ncbi:adenylate/guanylate cyclase domain-containing protein [Methylocapsa acidiphila]|uniref:adenylate/guanylate cyclase domain-containing protein n=1 Tax=Methylocapsa acidiphila TaxID=133552 RepID=UPI000423D36D|nr:adenylate/guanylate cyclase domain-containing protein [Methylocapsa acidiphila]